MTESQITFETQDGRELLLEGVHYDVSIDGLMATTTIAQNYKNPYDTNIEAVYTFPLTPDAVLLSVEIKINERLLKGKIIEKSEAEAQYEEAIDDGNRAIMVEKSSDGIYTVNIANLLPEDSISVIIEYTQLLEWRQDQVKWSLPTTIAPKYGDPSGLNLDDVTDPAISLLAENLFSFKMKIKGVLADSLINAPSHLINIDKYEDYTEVDLRNEKDFMDKDIVFTFKTQKSREERSFALVGKDFDGYAAIASFYPSFGEDLPREPKSVTFVIDCSGSMSGISIDRARTALHKALHLFTEEDSFNIIKFGSNHSALFDEEVPATQKNINIAKRMIRSLDADMGGTEMAGALQSAYSGHTVSKEKQGYLFLITDGEIYDHDRVVANARKSEMAHYVVGVGYASDDALLKKLASETRGSFESIDPNEKMDDYILNLFKKIDTPKAIDIKIEWPTESKIEHLPNVVFDGDTLYAYGAFEKVPAGDVTLSYILENGNHYKNTAYITNNDTEEQISVIAKIVVMEEIKAIQESQTTGASLIHHSLNKTKKESIILYSKKYQLFSELTNYILVDEVEEKNKPADLPRMVQVENMVFERALVNESGKLAFESVKEFPNSLDGSERRVVSAKYSRGFCDTQSSIDKRDTYSEDSFCYEEIPSSLKIDFDTDIIFNIINTDDYALYLRLFNEWYQKYHRLPRKKKELLQMGMDSDIVAMFNEKNFRKQIKMLVAELYRKVSEDVDLSSEFEEYMFKIQYSSAGVVQRVKEYVGQLF